jgi:hypothetical protein
MASTRVKEALPRWIHARRALLVVLLISLLFASARLAAVWRSVGYCAHPDERHLLENAREVLVGEDLNPGFFRYPSLPIYLTVVGFQASAVLGLTSNEANKPFRVQHGAGWPYEPKESYFAPRLLFGALGAGCFLALGWLSFVVCQRRFAGRVQVAWLAPVALAAAPLIQGLHVKYLNVDTPAIFFSLLVVATTLASWDKRTWLAKAILPGIFVGCATASKYNSGLTLAPAALCILFVCKGSRLRLLAGLGAVTAATFFLCVPYSILDFAHFKADVLFEIEHYKTGHPGHEAEPGWDQLVHYGGVLVRNYGTAWLALAALGAVDLLAFDRKRAVVALSFPLLMILHLSTNRVNFPRTVTPAFAFLPLFCALGVGALVVQMERLLTLATKRKGYASSGLTTLASAVVFCALFPAGRSEHLLDRNILRDTRSQVSDFLSQHRRSQPVWVPRDACFSNAEVKAMGGILVDQSMSNLDQLLKAHAGPSFLIVPDYGKSPVPSKLRRNKSAKKTLSQQQARRAAQLNKTIQQVVHREQGERMIHLKGQTLAVAERQNGPPLCASSPGLIVYRLQGTHGSG